MDCTADIVLVCFVQDLFDCGHGPYQVCGPTFSYTKRRVGRRRRTPDWSTQVFGVQCLKFYLSQYYLHLSNDDACHIV